MLLYNKLISRLRTFVYPPTLPAHGKARCIMSKALKKLGDLQPGQYFQAAEIRYQKVGEPVHRDDEQWLAVCVDSDDVGYPVGTEESMVPPIDDPEGT